MARLLEGKFDNPIFGLMLCYILTAIVFGIDMLLPLGTAAGVPYVVVIVAAAFLTSKRHIVSLLWLTSIAVWVGYFCSPVGGEFSKVIANRCLAVFAIVLSGLLALRIKELEGHSVAVQSKNLNSSSVSLETIDERSTRWGGLVGGAATIAFLYLVIQKILFFENVQIHTQLETVSIIFALIVGALALIRYYAHKEVTYLFVGTGFIAACFLDGVNCVVGSDIAHEIFPSNYTSLVPWSWTASRLFLGTWLLVGHITWRTQQQPDQRQTWITEYIVYISVGVLTFLTFYFFAFVALPEVQGVGVVFHRPQDLAVGLLFALVAVGYYRKGLWRSDAFERSLLACAVASACGESLVMAASGKPFDACFEFAHVVKIGSYAIVFLGLATNMYHLYVRAKKTATRLARNAEAQAIVKRILEIGLGAGDLKEKLAQSLTTLLQTSWLAMQPKGAVFLTDKENPSMLNLFVHQDLSPPLLTICDQVPFNHCLCGIAAYTRELQFADCVDCRHKTSYRGMEPHGHYNVPILSGETVLGVLVLYLDEGHKSNQSERAFMLSIGDALASLIVRSQMEMEMMLQRERAQESVKAKSEFLANMSHEIRTPMNGVLGMTDLLLETTLSAEQLDYAETIRSSAESLLAIINDILDFSKIEAGKLHFSPLCFNIRGLLQDIERMFLSRLTEKRIVFAIVVGDTVPEYVVTDPDRLRQILVNFMSNSIKFTEDGGGIIVNVACLRRQEATAELTFSVADSGIGIPAESQEVIFDAFSQADGTTTRKFGGTGLGLAISNKLVQMMNGRIELSSSVGMGSNFKFTVSLDIGDESLFLRQDEQESEKVVGEHDRSLRILLAEDNLVNQKLATKILQKMGHVVTTVSNGEEAINHATTECFDVVLMDIQMPVMDGVTATHKIKESDAGKKLPIIAMTAHAMAGDREKYLSYGMDGYITKPFRRNQLIEVLSEILAK